MAFRLQLADEKDGYRIVGPNGEEGALVDYGVPASLVIPDGELKGNYLALVETPNEDEWETLDEDEWELLEGVVFRAEAMETVVEHAVVQYEVVSEGEPERAGEEEEEEEEEEEKGEGEVA